MSLWHLINDPTARHRDLGHDIHTRDPRPHRKSHDPVRQPEDLGHDVALTPVTT